MLISVTGELDATNAGHFESALGRERRSGEPVILDLGGLTFMDSTGLHLLLRVHADLRRQNATLHLAAVQNMPARILQITGVWDALNIHPDVHEAGTAVREQVARRRRPS